jgi:hypothetical protein
MDLSILRAKLPNFSVIITEISGAELYYSDGVTGFMKLNIYEGTTTKYIGVIKGTLLKTTYDTGYEDCVKEWFCEVNQTMT